MALIHAQPLDIIDLHQPDDPSSVTVSRSLLRSQHLQLLRVVLAAGDTLPKHHVRGDVTIQCLYGEADLVMPSRTSRLVAGALVMLPAEAPHEVHAHENTVLLVTIVQP